MLRACVLDFGGDWKDYLPLVEFAYNNSYHASLGMPPYEALYGRKCRTPVCWGEIGQREIGSKDLVESANERIELIRARLKAAQDRQKSYADKRRKPIEFQVGDLVLLKVSPWKGIIHYCKHGKLSPRFVGPFKIIKRVGPVAYQLQLREEMSGIHDVFHISNLRKCLTDENLIMPLKDIQVNEKLKFTEQPMRIEDRKIKKLKKKLIALVKIKWDSKRGPEYTWELESEMRKRYPHLFKS